MKTFIDRLREMQTKALKSRIAETEAWIRLQQRDVETMKEVLSEKEKLEREKLPEKGD